MYPLMLKSVVKDYIWGGTRLKSEFGFETDREIAAEAWVLSCHGDGQSVVKNGTLAGKSLPMALDEWGSAALGKNAAKFPYFPILIKLIDAHDRLSIQVHPDDAYARENGGGFGKTEMWYVVDCEPGASLIHGFREKVGKDEFRRRIADNTLTEICNVVPVKKGDVFFIAAGTLHAIGKGILIAEVQQNSNTTYRVSDYGRLGADGKPRELHINQALDVTVTEPPKPELTAETAPRMTEYGSIRRLAECDFFTTEVISLDGETGIFSDESFVSLVVLDGSGDVKWDGGALKIKKGDSLFIPCGLEIKLSGKAVLLSSRV